MRPHAAWSVALFLLGAAQATAQPVVLPATIFFTMDSTHMAASGAGGTSSSPGNETAVFGDDSILMVFPDSSMPYTAYECSDFSTWAAHFGDVDGDGNYVESIVSEVDALHVPLTTPAPVNIFEVFVSFQVDVPAGGVLTTFIDEADVVRLLPRGGVVPFILRGQIAAAQGLSSATAINALDTDAFAVDPLNGDLYWSFTASTTVNGVAVQDGGVVRLRGSDYVANPDGTVASVTAGAAEIVLHETEVDGFFTTAGLSAVGDVSALEIDPGTGSFTSSSTGLTVRHLLFCSDAAANGPALVSSRGGGSKLDLNGVTFDNGPAMGLAATSFSGGAVGTLSALALRDTFLVDTPRMLDIFPTGVPTAAATTLTVHVGGATPNDFVLLVGVIGQGSLPGGFTPRHDIFEPTDPLHLLFTGDGRFYGFFPFNGLDGLFLLTLMDPPLATDALGHATRSYAVPALPPGIAFAFQYCDLFNLALSTPVIPVTQ